MKSVKLPTAHCLKHCRKLPSMIFRKYVYSIQKVSSVLHFWWQYLSFTFQILTPDFLFHRQGNKDMGTLVQVLNMKGIRWEFQFLFDHGRKLRATIQTSHLDHIIFIYMLLIKYISCFTLWYSYQLHIVQSITLLQIGYWCCLSLLKCFQFHWKSFLWSLSPFGLL